MADWRIDLADHIGCMRRWHWTRDAQGGGHPSPPGGVVATLQTVAHGAAVLVRADTGFSFTVPAERVVAAEWVCAGCGGGDDG